MLSRTSVREIPRTVDAQARPPANILNTVEWLTEGTPIESSPAAAANFEASEAVQKALRAAGLVDEFRPAATPLSRASRNHRD
jgi:hypothetical protein